MLQSTSVYRSPRPVDIVKLLFLLRVTWREKETINYEIAEYIL